MATKGKIFTLGREREKLHAAGYVRSETDRRCVEDMIDVVHNVLEGLMAVNDAGPTLVHQFISGGNGVWEQTGSWIRKLTSRHPELSRLWPEMAEHKSSKIRFRVAAFVNDIPAEVRQQLISRFLADPAVTVRAKVVGEVCICPTREVLPELQLQLSQEADASTLQALHDAIHAISSLPK